jgi:excisionase family DNA binding protein
MGELVERVAVRVAESLADRLTPAPDVSPWLNVDEAAEWLRCKPKRIYDLVSQHRLQAHHDGSRLLFRRDELDAYVLEADDSAHGVPLTPVPNRPPLQGISGGARTRDPQVIGPRQTGRGAE